MGNPLASSQFVRLLDDRLRKVAVDNFKELPSMIDRLFGVIKSDKAWEEVAGRAYDRGYVDGARAVGRDVESAGLR